jgi:hypothetical protein
MASVRKSAENQNQCAKRTLPTADGVQGHRSCIYFSKPCELGIDADARLYNEFRWLRISMKQETRQAGNL